MTAPSCGRLESSTRSGLRASVSWASSLSSVAMVLEVGSERLDVAVAVAAVAEELSRSVTWRRPSCA